MKGILMFLIIIGQAKVTLDFEKADINTVLRVIARVGHVNIITTPNVKGEVTAHLTNVPWKEALYAILEANGFAAIEEENVIRVMTLDELKALRQTMYMETQIFHVKYAKAEEVVESLRPLLSEKGSIQVEKRTNSIIVHDTRDNLSKISDMISQIDKPTPQVLIKTKIAKVDYKVARELGINWKTGNILNPTESNAWQATFKGGVGNPNFKLTFGTIRSGIDIDAILSALENEDKARIISEPSVFASDNEEALVLDGKKIPIITLDMAGNRVIKFYDVALKLTVVPHITPDSMIVMELHPELSDLSGEATAAGEPIILSSEIKTKIRVKNGETIVIGGIIRDKKGKVRKGLPLLSDIPLIGKLFSYTANTYEKSELLIFVTPQIISGPKEL